MINEKINGIVKKRLTCLISIVINTLLVLFPIAHAGFFWGEGGRADVISIHNKYMDGSSYNYFHAWLNVLKMVG